LPSLSPNSLTCPVGLDLLKGALHSHSGSIDVACREQVINDLERHHGIRPLRDALERVWRSRSWPCVA